MKKYDINEQRNAGRTCNNRTTEAQPPPNVIVATSAQRGLVVRQQRARTGRIQFDVSRLPEGTYYLHIEHNGKIEKHQIIVQR